MSHTGLIGSELSHFWSWLGIGGGVIGARWVGSGEWFVILLFEKVWLKDGLSL